MKEISKKSPKEDDDEDKHHEHQRRGGRTVVRASSPAPSDNLPRVALGRRPEKTGGVCVHLHRLRDDFGEHVCEEVVETSNRVTGGWENADRVTAGKGGSTLERYKVDAV